MDFKLNKILLNRKDLISINYKKDDVSSTEKGIMAATISKNFESYGYRLSTNLIAELKKTSKQDIINIGEQILENLKIRLGANVDYKPMYPDFPDSVMARSEAELYLDAFIYAESGFTIFPLEYELFDEENRKNFIDIANRINSLKTIDVGTQKDIEEIAVNLMSSVITYSQNDKEDLAIIAQGIKNFKNLIPQKIPNKENLTWLVSTKFQNTNLFIEKLNSATDILRVLVARNGGDTSLTASVKFGKLPKREIKQYAIQLARLQGIETEIARRAELFKRIFKQYHLPSIYKSAYADRQLTKQQVENMLIISNKLYNDELESTFESVRDKFIRNEDFDALIKLYDTAPGKLATDMDYILVLASRFITINSIEENYEKVYKALSHAVHKISANTLLRMQAQLNSRTEKKKYCVYAAKKGLANPYIKLDTRKPLSKDVVVRLNEIVDNDLAHRYAKKRPLGKVYLDEGLKNIKIPSSQRMNSKGVQTLPYGSQIPIEKGITNLRGFVWWTNVDKHPIDVDLSATFYDKEWNRLADCAYYELKGNGYGIHSGDIRDGGEPGGKGGTEFVDVDLENLKSKQVGYVVFSVNNYSQYEFSETPCKFGWMELKEHEKTLYNPLTVETIIELNCPSTRSVPVVFDVANEKMVWMDRNPKSFSDFAFTNNDVDRYAGPLMVEAYKAVHLSAPSLYHLIDLHIMHRGEYVDNAKEADVIFSVDRINELEDYPNLKENICAYDNDIILGDLLATELSVRDITYFEELETTE